MLKAQFAEIPVSYLKDIKIHNKLPFLIGTFVVAGQLFHLISVRTESFIFDLVLKFSASLLFSTHILSSLSSFSQGN